MFNFDKLETWQKAIAFADPDYEATRNFPARERSGLTNQMRRDAVSISSNIGESSGRNSKNEHAHFLEIATRSRFEVISQTFVSRRQGFLSGAGFKKLRGAAEEPGKSLSGLRRSVLEKT